MSYEKNNEQEKNKCQIRIQQPQSLLLLLPNWPVEYGVREDYLDKKTGKKSSKYFFQKNQITLSERSYTIPRLKTWYSIAAIAW